MVTDRDILDELRSVSDINSTHTIRHYLYFPNRSTAKNAAAKLVKEGYGVEDRTGADGINWLVLVTVLAVPTEALIASSRAQFELTASEYGGEYDGWEAEVVHRK